MKKLYLKYTIIFLLISGIGFGFLFINGKSLIWSIDNIGQFYPVFRYIGQYIRSIFSNISGGNFHLPTYDLSIGMGENIVGSLNYYGFGDPLNLLSVFANDTNGVLIFSASYIIRLYLAGLSFIFYCKQIRIDEKSSVIGAICYAFSGFAVCGGLMYITWMSTLIYFPLMLAGVEQIIRNRKKYVVLGLSICYGALCGFYFLYMCSLVLIVYCIVRLLFVRKNIKKAFLDCLFCAGVYLAGIILASPIFIPSVRAFLGSDRGKNIFDIVFNYHYYVPHVSTLIESLKTTVIPSQYDFAIGAFLVEWIFAIFLITRKNTQRNLQLKLGIIVSILAMSVKITGLLFNAFAESNDRWFFIIHFLFAVVLAQVLDDEESYPFKLKKNLMTCIVGILVSANILFNFGYLFSESGCNWKEEFIDNDKVSLYIDSPVSYFDTIKNDKELYRVATTLFTDINGRPENIAMLKGYYGMTYWYSIANKNVQKTVDEYNGDEMMWRSYGFNENTDAMNMMGVKYFVTDENITDFAEEKFKKIEETLSSFDF